MMLSLSTAYRSFDGEVEASSTPTICRLPDSGRHQIWAIARTQASDVAIWCALGHSRVAQRTTLICAIVLLRTKAAFCLVYRGGGGCEYRARRCHRSLLGLSRI